MIRPAESGGGQSRYQLKITLAWSKPPIWRRVIVPAAIRLDRLHDVIQIAMGWTDSHLHDFRVGETIYGRPDPDLGLEVFHERRHTLQDLATQVKQRFEYHYDFGDSWDHHIVVEKILPPDATFKHPVCLAGKNACPPEDCGGIPGYYDLIDAIKNPKHPRHEELVEWLGEEWDETAFDLDAINARLRALKT
jgi:Plasmid pRiA4b ORF-3-like protein